MKIKRGDLVKVISGTNKGLVGKVEAVDREKERLVIENGPKAKRHLKAEKSKKFPEGGIIEKPRSIHASNVMLMVESEGRPFRLGFEFKDGKKIRISRGKASSNLAV
jgi:large subunit ribosomal protein L24